MKEWAATGVGATGWWISLNAATDILQFVTAVIALISTCIGLWLFVRKARQ